MVEKFKQLTIFDLQTKTQANNLKKIIGEELKEYNIKENFSGGTLRELQEYLNKQKNYKEYHEKLIETLLKYFPLLDDSLHTEKTGIWDSKKGWYRYVIPKQSGPIYSLAYIPNEFFTKGVD